MASKYSSCKSQQQIMPAPAPMPKWRLRWIRWAVHSVVNLAILLLNVSYVQIILLTRSVKGIWREILYSPMNNIPRTAFLVSSSKTVSTNGISVRGHPSISLLPLSSLTLTLSICTSPIPLHHLQGPHSKADDFCTHNPMTFQKSAHQLSPTSVSPSTHNLAVSDWLGTYWDRSAWHYGTLYHHLGTHLWEAWY
jgi:hypothetical protein